MPTPERRALGVTNKSLRMKIRAAAPEEKLGYSRSFAARLSHVSRPTVVSFREMVMG
jgi:hypothetical protein